VRALKPGLAVGILPLLALAACRRPSGQAAPSPGEKRYALTGVVSSVNRAVREAVVAHDDIPGFMPAMSMPFPIGDEAVLETLKRGDQIAGTLVVGETSFRLVDVKVVREAPANVPPPASPSTGPEPDAGALPPDVSLLNQDGKKIRLSDYKGKALAVTFIFTRCPLPDFCPRMGTNFAAVAAAAAEDPALKDRVQLLTVTFDPEFDTPEVLRAWGKRYSKARDESRFTLATGEPEEIRRLAGFLSVEYDAEKGGGFTHNLRTAVIAPDGRLYRLHRGNDWTAEALLADLRSALGP
jgi:protein SCO1/2